MAKKKTKKTSKIKQLYQSEFITASVLHERDNALQEKFAAIGDQLALIIRLIDEPKCDNCRLRYQDLEYFKTLTDSYKKQLHKLQERVLFFDVAKDDEREQHMRQYVDETLARWTAEKKEED